MLNKTSDLVVILAHYNDNIRLNLAIASIDEPFKVDLVILDDGSVTTPDENELKKIYKNPGNLTLIKSIENIGVTKIRNLGLKIALENNYKYVGIMDSDDTNNPNRFEKQLNFLTENLDYGMIGSWGNYYNTEGKLLFTLKHPIEHNEIKNKMFLNSCFLNSSLLFKIEILKEIGMYNQKFNKGAEDYDFTFRALKKFKVYNYPESLVNITVRENGLSSGERYSQVKNRLSVIKSNFYFGFYPIYGLIRNSILLFIPRSLGITIRKIFKIEKLPI